MLDQQHRDHADDRGDRDGDEVLLQRQAHAHEHADQDGRQDGAAATDAQGPAQARGAHRHGVELAGVGVRDDLRADGGSARQAEQHEQHGRGGRLPQQRERHRCQRIHAGQHVLDMEPVGQPTATDGAHHRADVHHQHEVQRGAQAVAGAGHELGEP